METGIISIDVEKKMNTANGVMNLAVNFSIHSKELLAVFGSSGAGKTTLLRILAGLTDPDKGRVQVWEQVWFDSEKKINLSPQQRNISLMFQDYALFPNMTVEQNVQYAQQIKDNEAVHELLDVFGLSELKKQKTGSLSGGQKQRIALARALARKPKLLLLDEPLSALDSDMRNLLQEQILKAHQLLGATTIMVSHDLNEVFRLASKVVTIENGKIEHAGSPDEVFSNKSISGKVQITGQVALITKDDMVNIVTVISGNNQIIKVIAFDSDLEDLKIGDRVVVFTKAFNPIISKLR